MSGLTADNLLAVAAVWVAIMLPSAAFGGDPVAAQTEAQRCETLAVPPAGAALIAAVQGRFEAWQAD
ncbi:hypothetical protein [Kaistia nematophila]|uniref:Uncharacterized protein n=1 Tax=Kaistia nematophila TaxID=2994654 RepID=A0A9X3INP3_9HYPH|nr:hypothetical protein [Kaistia nematophila]MCX5571791.1 hypothetical protein [Kaistia nematophila]